MEHRPSDAALLLRKTVSAATRGETVALLMEAYLDLPRVDWAQQTLTVAPPAARSGVELTVARARLYVETGKDSSAVAFAEEAIKALKTPRALPQLRAEAHTILGQALYDQGAFRAALKALQAATEIDPRSARAFYQLALTEEDLKQPSEALAAMETAVKNDPTFAEAVYNLGRLYAEGGDPRAPDLFREYLKIDPKGPYAEDARAGVRGIKPSSSPPRSRRRGR
jgi:tetratricopeptide (TPR) repeat protein